MKALKPLWMALLAWFVLSAMACALYPVTMSDTCSRYAPMADAFARGDWYYAFHPRYGALFTSLAGLFAFLTGLPGVCTVQIAAFFCLAMAALAMFAFVREMGLSESVAWWTFVLVLLAPDYFRYAIDGLRDPGKCLVFALIAYGVAARSGWALGLSLFLYITLFTYGFAVSSAFVFFACVVCACRRVWRPLPPIVFGWLLGTAVVTVLTHAYTGHWLPAPQFIPKFGAWL